MEMVLKGLIDINKINLILRDIKGSIILLGDNISNKFESFS